MAKKILPAYRVLLYYKYVSINNPHQYIEYHLKFCKSLNLKGRIIVAPEGINGTVCGTYDQTEAYINAMRMDPRFEDMEFKIDNEDHNAFKKMFVRYKDELVTLKYEDDINPNEITGVHLSPEKFLEMMKRDDVVVVDARNEYEYELGHFKNAIKPEGIDNFKQFPDFVRKNLSKYKDKKILAYCTGGIRCEKFTGVLLKEGFKDVYQLHGGIVSYGKNPKTLGEDFEGKCYVFDERISVEVNKVNPVVVAKCHHCGKPNERYVNCSNEKCHMHFILCEECDDKFNGACSQECMKVLQEAM